MNTLDPHAAVTRALSDIAPDVDPTDLDADLHDDFGLDSMDLLNLATAIGEITGVEIAERDAPRLRTIRQLEAYIASQPSGGTR